MGKSYLGAHLQVDSIALSVCADHVDLATRVGCGVFVLDRPETQRAKASASLATAFPLESATDKGARRGDSALLTSDFAPRHFAAHAGIDESGASGFRSQSRCHCRFRPWVAL